MSFAHTPQGRALPQELRLRMEIISGQYLFSSIKRPTCAADEHGTDTDMGDGEGDAGGLRGVA